MANSSFRNNLERSRKACNLTIEELSQKTGFTITYIKAVEKGEIAPSPSFKKIVSDVLKIKVELIFPEKK